ncbi:MAG: putative lipid II flippase FtsW [Methylococcaceae bacterium]|nr:putative lipid II flippase FtsW [Methylococcaceae bacterium]
MKTQVAGRNRGLVLQWGHRRFYLDTVLLGASMGILVLGFIMVASASLHLGEKLANDSFYFPKHQLVHVFIGMLAAVFVASKKLEFWEKSSMPLFLFGLILLVAILIPGLGVKVNGSVRWLSLAGVRIQVSEVFKLIAVVYMASFITHHLQIVRTSWQGMLRPMMMLMAACVLLLKEPDFGSAAVIMAVALGMLYLAGARLLQFGVLLTLAGVGAGILVYSSAYRLKRVLSFQDPWADPLNTGFQLTQALIAFGRGEWVGVGLGSSVQKLFYLPEAHTDFLFSVIGEELGLMGACVVIVFFAIIVWRAFVIGKLAERMDNRFAAFIAYGLGLWFGLQAFINMGVNMGMLPTKGLTLPLMSYGGGSMIVMCSALALLFRVRSEVVEASGGVAREKSAWRRAS